MTLCRFESKGMAGKISSAMPWLVEIAINLIR
jgi:hypothetical protein